MTKSYRPSKFFVVSSSSRRSASQLEDVLAEFQNLFVSPEQSARFIKIPTHLKRGKGLFITNVSKVLTCSQIELALSIILLSIIEEKCSNCCTR